MRLLVTRGHVLVLLLYICVYIYIYCYFSGGSIPVGSPSWEPEAWSQKRYSHPREKDKNLGQLFCWSVSMGCFGHPGCGRFLAPGRTRLHNCSWEQPCGNITQSHPAKWLRKSGRFMIGVPACRSITGWDADPLLEKFKSSDFFHKGAMMVAGFQTMLVTCVFYLDVLSREIWWHVVGIRWQYMILRFTDFWAVKLYIHFSSHSSTNNQDSCKVSLRSWTWPEGWGDQSGRGDWAIQEALDRFLLMLRERVGGFGQGVDVFQLLRLMVA